MKGLEDSQLSPICPSCQASLVIRTFPQEVYAPMHIAFVGTCEMCGGQVSIVYTFNERKGLDGEIRNTQYKLGSKHIEN